MENIRKIVLGGLLSQTHPEQKAVILTGLSVVVNCSPSRVGLAHRKCLNCPLWTRKQFFLKNHTNALDILVHVFFPQGNLIKSGEH